MHYNTMEKDRNFLFIEILDVLEGHYSSDRDIKIDAKHQVMLHFPDRDFNAINTTFQNCFPVNIPCDIYINKYNPGDTPSFVVENKGDCQRQLEVYKNRFVIGALHIQELMTNILVKVTIAEVEDKKLSIKNVAVTRNSSSACSSSSVQQVFEQISKLNANKR